MKILIVRHGQTDMNVMKMLAGHMEAKLTEEGVFQAKCLGSRLKGIKIDRIYSSDLMRAKDTTGYLLEHLSAPVEYLEVLRERTWGELDNSLVQDYKAQLEASGMEYHKFKTKGGECVEEVSGRAQAFLNNLFLKHNSGTYLISAHHTMNKALLLNLLKFSWKDWPTFDQSNTCLNELTRMPDGTWNPDRINCTLHLAS